MKLARSALPPHSIDLSARALWALGRDDTLAVVAVGLPPLSFRPSEPLVTA
jgi:hypothetical protein